MIGLGLLFLLSPLAILALLAALVSLRGRMRRLESRVAELERRGVPGPLPTPMAAEAEGAGPGAPPGPAPAAGIPGPGSLPPSGEPAGIAEAPAPAAPAPALAWSQWEGRLGGAWLSRAGALLLILGAGFFLRYAFDREWIGPAGRVTLGYGAGVGMLVVGRRLLRAYRGPAQSLVATGIAVLYLSAYAAHAFYGLVGLPVTFLVLAGVAAIGTALAVGHEARALAFLSALGGFAAPMLLATGEDPGVPLLGYLGILGLGLVVAGIRRGWSGLTLLAFAGTQLLYWGWLDRWYGPERLPLALGAATGYLVLFGLAGAAGRRPDASTPGPPVLPGARALVVLAAPALHFLAAHRMLGTRAPGGLALLCLVLAGLYLAASAWAWRSPRAGPPVATLHAAVALGLVTLALAVRLERHHLVMAWGVEALGLLWAGLRARRPRLRAAGLAVLGLAWGRWLGAVGEDAGRAGAFLLAHPALPATVAVALAAAGGALLYRRRPDDPDLGRAERAAGALLALAAVGSPAWLLTVELGQYRTLVIPPPYVSVVKTVVWMLAAMATLALARADRTRLLLGAASGLIVVLAGATLEEASRWDRFVPDLRPPVVNPRFLGACLLVVLLWLYGRVVPGFPHVGEVARRRLAALASAAAGLLMLWNLSAEVLLWPLEGVTRWDPAKLRSTGLSVLWALCAFGAMGVGLWQDRPGLRVGALVLFGVTVAKVLLVDLADLDAVYRILSFVVLGAALLLASFLHARWRRRPPGTVPP
jgi:uncharacterized membrane protein